jgi:hypothetical protein
MMERAATRTLALKLRVRSLLETDKKQFEFPIFVPLLYQDHRHATRARRLVYAQKRKRYMPALCGLGLYQDHASQVIP